MERQEMFDTTWKKLEAQRAPCGVHHKGDFKCLYAEGYNRCAAGALFNDEEIALIGSFQGDVYDLKEANLLPDRFVKDIEFLSELQFAHDVAAIEVGVDMWWNDVMLQLRNVAEKWKLEVPK